VKISRRIFLGTVGIGLVTPAGAQLLPQTLRTKGNQPAWRHAASLFGDVKYPPGFCHFDYTNPAAVKGGSVRQSAPGTFDNFNVVTDGVKSNLAAGIDLIHDTLLLPSLDEPASKYGLLAEALAYPADFSWVRYRLRPEARWHDGIPITPKDVIFSFHTFKQHSPRVAGYYRHVTKVEVTGEREITFRVYGSSRRSWVSSPSCRSTGGKQMMHRECGAQSAQRRSRHRSVQALIASRASRPVAISCTNGCRTIGANNSM
jgi:microcin C transport system substrate-binding protein